MLTTNIRSTLDRHTILKTTLVELGKTLQLENCMVWMAKPGGHSSKLTLSHQLKEDRSSRQPSISTDDPVVQPIFSVSTALLISSKSRLAAGNDFLVPEDGSVVAIRVPILSESHAEISQGGSFASMAEAALEPSEEVGSEGTGARSENRASGTVKETDYAVLVLRLPNGSARRWRSHELEMVESVADQGECQMGVLSA